MKAAVLRAYQTPLEIEEIEIDKPGAREVLVRTIASGVCHSDLHVLDGTLPAPLPTVLGHEPAGIVEQVGHDVQGFEPGDHVIGCLSAFCGHCEFCLSGRPNLCGGEACNRPLQGPARLSKGGVPLQQFAHLSSFAEQMLVHENALVRIRKDMPLDCAALIGCGVTTGLGAALRSAHIEAGSQCAVIGCGGVGLAAIQGCRIGGAGRIIAIDKEEWKLDLARTVGATDAILGGPEAPAKVLEMTSGGVDYFFECIGVTELVAQGLQMVKKGGAVVMVGVIPPGQMIELPGLDITLSEKRVLGSMMGSNRFRIDMPRYVDFYLSGQLKLEEMISHHLELGEINRAFDAMRKRSAARSVIRFSA